MTSSNAVDDYKKKKNYPTFICVAVLLRKLNAMFMYQLIAAILTAYLKKTPEQRLLIKIFGALTLRV